MAVAVLTVKCWSVYVFLSALQRKEEKERVRERRREREGEREKERGREIERVCKIVFLTG